MQKETKYLLGLSAIVLGLFAAPVPAAAETTVNTDPRAIAFHQTAAAAAAKETAKTATPSESGWYWLSSDDKYSKYIDLQSVVAMPRHRASGVPGYETEVQAWTKTTYSYEGAAETLEAYELQKKISNPAQLAYSTALLSMNPQTRQLWYMEEHFYDSSGKVIWSSAHDEKYRDDDAKGKEINSQAFDEKFYLAAIDRAYPGAGEETRAQAKDRWLVIFSKETTEGVRYNISADTTTMRLEKNNLIFWAWQETKDTSGRVVDVVFQKMAVNLPESTLKVIRGNHWTAKSGWQTMDDQLDGHYRMIPKTSEEYQMVTALRSYVETNGEWVSRFERKYAKTK